MSKTSRILKQLKSTANTSITKNNMILPNNSGDHQRGIKRNNPVNDYDLMNKSYFDSNTYWKVESSVLQPKTTQDFLVKSDGGNIIQVDVSDNNLGFGAIPTTSTFFYVGANKTFNNIANFRGMQAIFNVTGTDTTTKAAFNFESRLKTDSGSIVSGNWGMTALSRFENNADCASSMAYRARGRNLSGGTIGSHYNYYSISTENSGGGTIDNAYGLYIESETAATNNWAIKTNAGQVEFGDDTFWTGSGSGLPYAEIYATDNSTQTTITVAGTAVQVTIFDTNGESNLATPDHTNDHITIVKAGRYMINVSATVNSIAGAASRFEISVQKNNGASEIIPHMNRNLTGGAGESGVISMSGIASLAANDTIEVWIENETNTQNYIVEDISLSLFQLGG